MTAEQCARLAMARTSEITNTYPSTRSLIYRRASQRQRWLMTAAAKTNPDYYGVCAVSALDAKLSTDLNDIADPVPTPELIEVVTVEDKGTSLWAAGQSIAIVTRADVNAELPPRAMLRDLVLQSVNDDLAGVVSIMIWYSRLAEPLDETKGDQVLELEDPWNELLVIDGAIQLLGKATRLDATVRAQAVAALQAEETPLLAAYLAHVKDYVATTTRFARGGNR